MPPAAAVVSGVGASAGGAAAARPLARIVHARSELLRPPEGGPDAVRLRACYNEATQGMALQMSLPADWAAQTQHVIGCGTRLRPASLRSCLALRAC